MTRARIALLALLTISCLLDVHASDGRGVSDRLREILRDLPEAKLRTGILYDRVAPLSRIADHDGVKGDVPVTLREWKQMYGEIAGAGPESGGMLPPLREVEGRADANRGVVPIAILNTLYDRIRPAAFEDGTLVVRDGHVEIAGAGEPFQVERVFAVAPLRDRTFRGSGVVFRLDRRDYFTNDPSPVGAIEIDFGDGSGFQRVAFDEGRIVRYAGTGIKVVRVRLALADGSTYRSSFSFDVLDLVSPSPTDTLHITATIPYQGVYGTGDAYVYLSDRHTTLTEPVVLIEGFDPDNTMNWDELYALLNRQDLIENLRGMGFDAVVLNFTNGGDYIQRNAYVCVELVRQVRQAIGAGRTMALVGASMGGLVARYALSYMEANGIPHDVRTFISFDSPQAGADVPLGMQYWLWFFASESQDAAANLADLDTPAARQMLVYHYTDPPGSAGSPDGLRSALLNDLAAVGGYPAIPRKVAIANGSGGRQDQGFAPGDQIIQWEYSSFLVSFTGNSWAVPSGASRTIFHGLIEYFYIPWDEATVTVSGTLPYDGAPGGWRDSMAQLGASDPGYGDIIALHPNHCFIPTISSLALDTTDLFYDVAGDADILQHTPFDAVYFPTANQEHVDITAENASWFIGEIVQGANDVPDGVLSRSGIARIGPVVPNPFEASTRIAFAVPTGGPVRLAVFDPSGRQVAVIQEGSREAGESSVVWNGDGSDGKRLAPGIYFVELSGNGFAASRKVLLR